MNLIEAGGHNSTNTEWFIDLGRKPNLNSKISRPNMFWGFNRLRDQIKISMMHVSPGRIRKNNSGVPIVAQRKQI